MALSSLFNDPHLGRVGNRAWTLGLKVLLAPSPVVLWLLAIVRLDEFFIQVTAPTKVRATVTLAEEFSMQK